jgi:hypothetical protein
MDGEMEGRNRWKKGINDKRNGNRINRDDDENQY